jgi:hypothetical protein
LPSGRLQAGPLPDGRQVKGLSRPWQGWAGCRPWLGRPWLGWGCREQAELVTIRDFSCHTELINVGGALPTRPRKEQDYRRGGQTNVLDTLGALHIGPRKETHGWLRMKRVCGGAAPAKKNMDPYEPLRGSLWNSSWPKQGREGFQEVKNEKRSPASHPPARHVTGPPPPPPPPRTPWATGQRAAAPASARPRTRPPASARPAARLSPIDLRRWPLFAHEVEEAPVPGRPAGLGHFRMVSRARARASEH